MTACSMFAKRERARGVACCRRPYRGPFAGGVMLELYGGPLNGMRVGKTDGFFLMCYGYAGGWDEGYVVGYAEYFRWPDTNVALYVGEDD